VRTLLVERGIVEKGDPRIVDAAVARKGDDEFRCESRDRRCARRDFGQSVHGGLLWHQAWAVMPAITRPIA
jgi:hypothetical protein